MSQYGRNIENIHLVGINWRAPVSWLWCGGAAVLSAAIGASSSIVTTVTLPRFVDAWSTWWVVGLSNGLLFGVAVASVLLTFKRCTKTDRNLWKSSSFRKLDEFYVGFGFGFLASFLSLAILSGAWKLLEIELAPPIAGCSSMAFVSAMILVHYICFYLRYNSFVRGISSTG